MPGVLPNELPKQTAATQDARVVRPTMVSVTRTANPLADGRGPVPDGGDGPLRGDHHSTGTQHERASVGKIARLPKAIREMLNRRLDDGAPSSELAAWLNELPPVQTVMASYFRGAAISEKNISNWRLTGFKRWQERQDVLAEVRELSEEAADLNEANPDGLMRMTATLACTKLLRALRDTQSGVEVTKAAFAIAALNNVEMSHIRVEHEDRRLQQKDEMVSLAYDKHYRNCAAIADRIKGDEQIDMVKQADIDNRDKIELIGRRMFGNLWKKRRLPWEDENFNKDEEVLERMEAERQAKEAANETNGTQADWTDGTDEPGDQSPLPVNPYGGKTTKELMAEAESLSRNCRNTGSTCRPSEETAENIQQKETKTTEPVNETNATHGSGGTNKPSPHPDPLPSHPMGAEREQQPGGVHDSKDQQHASVVSPTRVPETADAEVRPVITHLDPARQPLNDYERAIWAGKTHEEALYALFTPVAKPKDKQPGEESYPNSNLPEAFSTPLVYHWPEACPTKPLPPLSDGPCEPPLTSASLRNLW